MVVISQKIKSHKPLTEQMQLSSADEDDQAIEENENAGSDGDEQIISKEALIVLQEINIARNLAGNDPIKRNRQVRKLRQWLRLRAQSSFPFTEDNFMRLWKGLYYCMYMADKPLYQEELAENIGQLVGCFAGKIELSVEFYAAFLNTMRNEWFGIDQWRMDKFYMLMRRMLRHMLRMLQSVEWISDAIELYNKKTLKTVLAERDCAMAITMHYMDIMFEELAKVSEGAISAEQVNLFLQPFLDYLIDQTDGKLFSHCRSRIFHHLIYQSGLGREYQEKYEAWKEMGFPTSINDVEMVEEAKFEDDKTENTKSKHLDPRAGNVDVFVPELPLDGAPIVKRLEEVIIKNEMPAKRRKMLRTLLRTFETYQNGEFPLGIKTMPRFKDDRDSEIPIVDEKIAELEETESELYGVTRKLKQLNKRKRRKLLKSLNYDNVQPDEVEKLIEKAIPKMQNNKQQRLNEKRDKFMKGWIEEILDEDIENKKIVSRKQLKMKERLEKFTLRRKEKLKKKKLKQKQTEIIEDSEGSINKKAKMNDETANKNDWMTPLGEGEIEYFVPSRKITVKSANLQLARKLRGKSVNSPKLTISPRTPISAKRVKIALNHNCIQKPSDYIKQIKNSPDVPFDATRKPGKGLLKPNAMPSPVDPFYVKRHSLKLNYTQY